MRLKCKSKQSKYNKKQQEDKTLSPFCGILDIFRALLCELKMDILLNGSITSTSHKRCLIKPQTGSSHGMNRQTGRVTVWFLLVIWKNFFRKQTKKNLQMWNMLIQTSNHQPGLQEITFSNIYKTVRRNMSCKPILYEQNEEMCANCPILLTDFFIYLGHSSTCLNWTGCFLFHNEAQHPQWPTCRPHFIHIWSHRQSGS